MKHIYLGVVNYLFLFVTIPVSAQVAASSAAVPNVSIATVGTVAAGSLSTAGSIVLTGMVVRDPTAPGRSAEPIWLQVDADGRTQMKISASSGTIGEARSAAGQTSACTTTHDVANKPAITAADCWSSASWVLPTVALANSTVAAKLSSSFAAVTHEGTPAFQLKLQISTAGRSPGATQYIQTVTARTLYLNPQTLLPSSMTYSEHPGNNIFINIPIEIIYSDYRTMDGVTVPFHIIKKINGLPILDISITQVAVS